MKSYSLLLLFLLHVLLSTVLEMSQALARNQDQQDQQDQIYLPYSKEAIIRLQDMINNDHDDLKNLRYHREILGKYIDLYNHGDHSRDGQQPIYDEDRGNTDEDEEERRLFIAHRPSFQWMNQERRIPCNVIHYIKDSKEYLFERYKTLRERALLQIEAIESSVPSTLEKLSQEYETILKEMKSVLILVERAYPLEFQQPDRLAKYTFKVSEEFKELLDDPDYRPGGNVKVSKIKFAAGKWIPLHGEIKGYMNFISEANIVKMKENQFGLAELSGEFRESGELGGPETFENYDSELEYAVHLVRELSPLEACLSNLHFEMIGHTGKVKREMFIPIRPFLPRPPRPPLFPYPIDPPLPPFPPHPPIPPRPPWPWGPAVDPPKPDVPVILPFPLEMKAGNRPF